MNGRFFLILLLIVCCATQATAQFPEYGKIDISDLKQTSCPIDKMADAMILLDYQWIKISPEGYTTKITVEKRVRIKIFNEKGFKHANIKIPYLHRSRQTKMKEISGIVYNLDEQGKIVTQKIERNQIFKNKAEDNISSINFSFPNIKPGSVIEYRYTQIDHDSYIINPWTFQTLIPVMEAYCNITLPGWQRLNYRIKSDYPVQKDDPNSVANSNNQDEKLLRLSARDIPAFTMEPFMTSIKDNFPRVEFSLRGSSLNLILDPETHWGVLNRSLWTSSYFGTALKDSIPGTEGLIDTAKKLGSKEEQVSYLYYYLQKNIKWNKRRHIYAYSLEDVWKNKTGNSADINLLFLNLLTRLKIQCNPILVSTREHGIIDRNFPNLGQFNGVTTWVNDTTVNWLMDPSVQYISHKVPPPNIMNRYGFVVDSTKGEWVYLTDKRPLQKTIVSVQAKFDSTNSLVGQAAVLQYDYAKADVLLQREKSDEEEDEDEKKAREKKQIDLTTYDYTKEGEEDPLKPLFETFKFKYQVTNTNDLYYFEPNFLSSLTKNPFVANQRLTDIDLGGNQYISFTILLEIPGEMEVEGLPAPVSLRNSDTSIVFRRLSALEGNKAMLKFTLEFNSAIIPKEEYQGLKEYYKKLYGYLSEQIVLRRKTRP